MPEAASIARLFHASRSNASVSSMLALKYALGSIITFSQEFDRTSIYLAAHEWYDIPSYPKPE